MPAPLREVKGGYVGDLLSWVMGRAREDNIWVTIMTNVNILAVATLSGVSAILVAENAEIDASVTERAQKEGINLLRTSQTAFAAAVAIGKVI